MALNKQKRVLVWCMEKSMGLHEIPDISFHNQYQWTDCLKYHRSPRNSEISRTSRREKRSRCKTNNTVMINRRLACPFCKKKFYLKIMRTDWGGELFYRFPSHKKWVKVKK